MDARQAANGVFDGGSWEGEGADAARAAYNEAASIKFNQAEISRVASGLFKRASSDVGMTKRLMGKESDAAHKEIEAFLRSGSGQSLAQVAVILGVHRTAIQGYSSDLQGFATQYTTQFTNHFKESPGGGRNVRSGTVPTSTDRLKWSSGSTRSSTVRLHRRRPTRSLTQRRTAQRRKAPGTRADTSYRPGPIDTSSTAIPPRPSHNPVDLVDGWRFTEFAEYAWRGFGRWDSDVAVAGADGRVWGCSPAGWRRRLGWVRLGCRGLRCRRWGWISAAVWRLVLRRLVLFRLWRRLR